ncbi:MAG: hypothetical protein A2V70_02115 [Planctomycetes bacterium RBG_13_63_9]|nr:MAG: hypothetical protein A2V70_02115 [Planctomycetes bacterium RBG_13_63_9]
MQDMRIAVITCDTDWVEEETMEQAYDALCSLGKPVTYFLTQRYGLFSGKSALPAELAVHPNYEATLDLQGELRRCLAFVPGAQSFRAHSLFWTERLRPVLWDHGITVSSSVMMYLQAGIHPYPIAHGITEIPLFWMDMFHMEMCALAGMPPFDAGRLHLEYAGLKVLDIHPVHIVLNTQSLGHYRHAKQYYHQPGELAARRAGGRGVWDFFRDMVGRLDALGYHFCLLRDARRGRRFEAA